MSESRHNPDQLLKEIQADEENRNKGHLKIFFGYAAGVGKTYAMLEAAHMEKQQGIDVVAGYVETHARPKTAALLNGLEVLPTRKVFYNGMILDEFDIGMALKRKPQLILVDELAHTNAEGCRHAKRYQDIKELLNAGIDVYTTVNVQHIESLCDTVASITEIVVRERIPDSIFDNADQVELIDIEPQDLINRLNTENVYRQTQAKQTVENFFTIENLTALREISLRRRADRVNILTENTRIKNHGDYHTGEHILVCLSSSPSNAKIIRTAAKMASAFKGEFTALFVETPDFSVMSEENVKRLRSNIRLAEQLGAKIETVYGEDVPFQIAEFTRLSGVSKIVIGRSSATKRHLLSKPTLTEKLIDYWNGKGFKWKTDRDSAPSFFDPSHPAIGALTETYNELTDRSLKPYTMGGGTYARKLPRAFGFGIGNMPDVKKEESSCLRPGHGNAHGADEVLDCERLSKALEIYVMGLLALKDVKLLAEK